jgi:7,8-dihydropterin-6-yl-methyl-4-(beta-D-ribofuranosyl)aminobenzene 5'-phosphate synthase
MLFNNLKSEKKQHDFSGVRLTILFDAISLVRGLQTGWGFSCLVEVGGTKVLFDTGGNGAVLLSNMNKLNIRPESVNLVLISHNSYGHIGGLNDFCRENPNVSVYIPESFPHPAVKAIEKMGTKVIRITSFEEIQPNIFTLGEFAGLFSEQAMVLRTPKGIVVVIGYGHNLITDILQKAKTVFPDEPIYLVSGGFHFGELNKPEKIKFIEDFKDFKVQRIAPYHCCEKSTLRFFKRAFGKNYIKIGVGKVINIDANN